MPLGGGGGGADDYDHHDYLPGDQSDSLSPWLRVLSMIHSITFILAHFIQLLLFQIADSCYLMIHSR